MSKFIDKMEKVGLQLPTPLGFGTASKREEQPPAIMLVGHVTPDELAKTPGLAEAKVDAFLVSLGSWDEKVLDSIKEALGDRIWGVRVGDGINEEQAGLSKDKGCDFIVFEANNTSAAVLNDEDMGKVIAVDNGLDEDAAHAMQGLSIDGAMYSPEGDVLPLTVQRLIEIQQVHGLTGDPFVMSAPSELGAAELEAFRNAGITGLLVELSALDAVAKTREAINKLPRRKHKTSKGNIMPLVPFAPAQAESNQQEEEEEGGEDDF